LTFNLKGSCINRLAVAGDSEMGQDPSGMGVHIPDARVHQLTNYSKPIIIHNKVQFPHEQPSVAWRMKLRASEGGR